MKPRLSSIPGIFLPNITGILCVMELKDFGHEQKTNFLLFILSSFGGLI